MQKSAHQVAEFNHETYGSFVKPTLDLYKAEKNWDKLTAGLGEEEVADLNKAREVLQNYARVYDIFEYASDINATLNVLETRIFSNNKSLAPNAYRFSSSNSINEVFPEIERCLEAYYGLIDDLESEPAW